MIDKLAPNSGVNPATNVSLDRLGIAGPVRTDATANSISFEQAMAELAVQSANKVRSAELASKAGIVGEMPVQQVVSSVMEAERTFQTAIAVRDKVVAAYLEISRMQI
ncbi:MAG: flagellar hook-basal body complex protein FliE [Pseudomonadota bacterium]